MWQGLPVLLPSCRQGFCNASPCDIPDATPDATPLRREKFVCNLWPPGRAAQWDGGASEYLARSDQKHPPGLPRKPAQWGLPEEAAHWGGGDIGTPTQGDKNGPLAYAEGPVSYTHLRAHETSAHL
eukprot:14608494-Alexandrium_andersonii.AAC.1